MTHRTYRDAKGETLYGDDFEGPPCLRWLSATAYLAAIVIIIYVMLVPQ